MGTENLFNAAWLYEEEQEFRCIELVSVFPIIGAVAQFMLGPSIPCTNPCANVLMRTFSHYKSCLCRCGGDEKCSG